MKRRNFLKGILGVAATAAGVSTVEHEMSMIKKSKSNDINGKQVFEDRIVGFRAYDRVLTNEEIDMLHKISQNETFKIWKA